MSLTNYGETAMLSAFKELPATSYYLGLFTSTPSESSVGTEVSGGAYARIPVTFDEPIAGDPSYIVNSSQLEFPTATASWGTTVAWGIFDAETNGNLVWYGSMSVAKEVTANDTILIKQGEMKLTLD